MNRTVLCVVVLLGTLLSRPAAALSARLIDVPRPGLRLMPPGFETAMDGSGGIEAKAVSPGHSHGFEMNKLSDLLPHAGITAAVGVVTVPLGLYLASWIGTWSNQLIWAALPSLLVMGFFAPTLVALAAQIVGNLSDPGRFGFWAGWGASVIVNMAALVIGGFAGLSIGMPGFVLLFGLIDAVAMSAATVGVMHLFENKAADVPTVQSFVPGVSDTRILSLSRMSF